VAAGISGSSPATKHFLGVGFICSRAEMVVGRSDLLQSPGELMLGKGGIDLLLQKHAAHNMLDELSVPTVIWDEEKQHIFDHPGLLKQLAQGGNYFVGEEKKPTAEPPTYDVLTHVSGSFSLLELGIEAVHEFDEIHLEDNHATMPEYGQFMDPVTSKGDSHMPVVWDDELLHGLDCQDALVQKETQFDKCLVNKARVDLLTNSLPPHGNDSFLTEFDRDGANKLFNSLQHEVFWDEEMPSGIGTHESVVLTPVSTSGLLKQCINAAEQVFVDFPSTVVVWDEELFHDLDSHDRLLQKLALGGECWNGEKMICIPISPSNRWSDPFSDFESVQQDMTAQIDNVEAILTDMDHVKHELGAAGSQVSACAFSETIVLEIRQETIDACNVLTERLCQEEDTKQLVEQVVSGIAAVSEGPVHVLFDQISPNEMATTHLEQAVFMTLGVFAGDAAEVLVKIFGQVVWDEMPAAIGTHHGLLQYSAQSGDYFGDEKKGESVDPVTTLGRRRDQTGDVSYHEMEIGVDDLENEEEALLPDLSPISENTPSVHKRMQSRFSMSQTLQTLTKFI
jgi:hypothetical protein